MDSRVEEKRPKKHKPKRKISELDEEAAKRRRTQTCLAQQAFRQRKENTITSLNAQVTDLQRTIEDLNACFLTLTDELAASGWLEQDRQVTKALKGTIERFITLVGASHVFQENNQIARDHTSSSTPKGLLVQEDTRNGVSLPGNESIVAVTGSVSDSNMTTSQDLTAGFDSSHNSDASEHVGVTTQSEHNTVLSKTLNRPTDFQIFPYDFVPTLYNASSCTSQLPVSMDSLDVSFAQRLHLEAIRDGLRLVCTAENRFQDFYRVFNFVLNFHTRESLRIHLNKVLNENFDQLLQPPPETDVRKSWSEGLYGEWFNASDVARHFRQIGMDFDRSTGIAIVEIHPGSVPNGLLNAQELSATRLITLLRDRLAKTQPEQPPQDLAYLSSTAHQYFARTAQDVNNSEICAKNHAYTTLGYDRSHISIDVSKLIYDIVLGARCFGRNPAFNRNDLDDALARAVIETH